MKIIILNKSLQKILGLVLLILFVGITDGYSIGSDGRNNVDAPDQMTAVADQPIKITGMVIDESGMPLPGVAVIIEGTTQGTITDGLGRYSIEVPKAGMKLVFSFIGFVNQSYTIEKGMVLDVKLKEEAINLEEMTVVAFGKQKKESVLSSITTTDVKDLKVPSSNLTTAFAGKLAGVIAYQTSGDPGMDGNVEYFVRGVSTFGASSSPLILIDGVESTTKDLARLQPDDIASFSIMKDATATALYGARGANGVMLVTTKLGKEGSLNINVRFENTFSSATQKVEFADPVTFMRLHNEAITTRNPLGFQLYNPEKIDNTIMGTNPLVYPAVDWYKMLFRDVTSNQRANFSASGGGKKATYYIAGTYNVDNGALKVDGKNNFNNNVKLKTYQLRMNTNLSLTKTTEAIARVTFTMDDYNGPLDSGNDMYKKVMQSNPVLFPAYYPAVGENYYKQHIMFGNYKGENGYYLNPYAEMVKGYKQSSMSKVVALFELKQDLSMLVKGLKFRTLFSTDRYSYTEFKRSYKPFYYNIGSYDPVENSYTLNQLNPDGGEEWLSYDPNKDVTQVSYSNYWESALNYDVTLDDHTIGAMLVSTMRNAENSTATTLESSLPVRNIGISGRASYSYDSRYFAEFNFGYNGSERFAKNNRFGFFPSAGLGWLVSNEDFWGSSTISSIISKLKLKATYGLVGNDRLTNDLNDRFFYLSNVNMANNSYGYTFGTMYGNSGPGVSINRYANELVTWEESTKSNFGFEVEFLKAIEIQADYFIDDRSSILLSRSAIPSTMGLQSDVKANVGAAQSKGWDISLDLNKSFANGLWMSSHSTFTYAHSVFKKYDEPDYSQMPWLSRIGNPINQTYGYVAERLFIDEQDIANSPEQTFGTYMPGDIKYKDINNDGVINTNDKVAIGFPTVPEINYGFGLSTGYKGIDFSFFFQGSGRKSFWIDPYATSPFVKGSVAGGYNQLLKVYADDHWSEANQNSYALWPRLSDKIVANNTQPNTWFMRDGSFLRLKNVELGYTLEGKRAEKLGIKSLRLYYTGVNLLMFSGFDLWDAEMGGNGLGYPIQRTHSLGVQISL